ncbi:MAG: TetR/AcrR family transcriptional regulator [Steroidobacteraceae bacterium]|jgi:TetR/AcrR family transcriptional regulator, transcriptional repressor for nem operon
MSRIADIKAPKSARALIPDTATRILDAAERLVQSRGYNGFSYADIAARVGITKASLHHHFETKATLGEALIERYRKHFMQALAAIDANAEDAADRLRSYAGLYAAVLEGERLCLCGMLAAEYDTLPTAMQEGIRKFFNVNEEWLAGVLEEGRRRGRFHRRDSARETARLLLSALEGAMLVARPYHDVARFNAAAGHLLAGLQVDRPPGKSTRHLRERRQAS